MKINREQWSRLSVLLDAALDIDASERDAWLQNLPLETSELKEPLRTLLAQRARSETAEFLKTPDFSSALLLETVRAQMPPLDLLPAKEVGAYRLTREIGRGGMGAVWLAERVDGKLKRQVALKFPYAGPNQRQLAERLARERDILASLEHPNIARLYDADVTAQGQPFLVLEYVDGIAINDYCDQQRLSVRDRLVLFLQVLNAMQYAHTHLVIHRDLKPSNILVTSDRVVRLLDFGIAKLISEGEAKETAITQFGGRALTLDYASPEQIAGQPITTASDVYSLGVVLYELLTSHRPYRLKRDTPGALEDAIAEANVTTASRVAVNIETAAKRSTTPKELAAELRGDLDTILLKALRKDSNERYASVDAFRRDLERSLDNEPVEAQPHSRVYLLNKLVARNKLACAAIGVVLLSLIAGVGASLWQAEKAKASERRAIASAETSEAVKQFMVRIFQTNTLRQEDPAKARQQNALELLEAGANRLAVEFKDQPALHREMLSVILPLLAESRSNEYVKHALEYIELSKNTPGTELQQATLYTELAMQERGKTAEGYAQAGLQVLVHSPQSEAHKIRGMLLWTQANAMQGRGDYDGADAYLLKARDELQSEYSKTTEYGHVMSGLAGSEFRRNNMASGLEYLKRAMEAIEGDPTAYQKSIASGRVDLGIGYFNTNQFAAAEKEFRTATGIFEKSYGSGDSQTAFTKASLGSAIAKQNRYDEAIAILGPAVYALENPTATINSNADYLIRGAESFADALVQSGRLKDAAPAVQSLLKFVPTAATRRQVAPLFVAADYELLFGRNASAERYARQAIAAGIAAYGEQGPRMRSLNNKLGRILIETGKLDEADELFTNNIKIDAEHASEFNSAWTVASVQHARVLLIRGQAREASLDIAAALTKFLSQASTQRVINDEIELQLLLGQALIASDHAAEALPHLERVLELRQTQYAFSPRLAEAQIALAECKLKLGDSAGSHVLFVKAKAIHAANAELGQQYRRPLAELGQRLATADAAHSRH